MKALDQAKQRLQKALSNVEHIIIQLQEENVELKNELKLHKESVANEIESKNEAPKPQNKKEETPQTSNKEVTVNDLKKLVGIN